ncbi:TPA: HK97 family phage prohead protease [Clostridium perfringens]|nr:HK97 family phage prohead protease [Clostridium perfringens]
MQNLEIREQDGKRVITGYVNVPNKLSNPLKDKNGKIFVETVETGVFAKAINEAREKGKNIPLMFRHKDIISDNVEICEDEVGVKFTAYDVREDIFNQIQNDGGKINCSFGFTPIKEKVIDISKNLYKRILEEINLLEITITPYPAYNSSVAYTELREEGEDEMELRELLELREELDKKIEELTDKELEEEKKDEKEDKVEKPIEEKIAEIDVQIAEEEVNEKEKEKESIEHEIAQKRLILEKAKMQLELIKLKAE